MNFVFVAAGGALGAVCRYALSLVSIKSDFPVMTFLTNLLGAFAIGIVVGLSLKNKTQPNLILFLKTGFCGGFTTFSTFSLEAFNLFAKGAWGTALLYALASLTLCIAGVGLGLFVTGK